MPARVVPTPSVVVIGGVGPLRTMQSAIKPECPKCKSSDHVVRFWHGKQKMWACSECFKVTSNKKKEATLKQRIMHKIPEADTSSLGEVLLNRKARRRRK